MRRALAALIVAASLTLGTATAGAEMPGGYGGFPISEWLTPHALVVGTVQSVDPTAGSFTAQAYVVNPFAWLMGDGGPPFGGGLPFLGGLPGGGDRNSPSTTSAPTPTLVTITPDAHTLMLVNGRPGTVSDLSVGDRFLAVFDGSPTDSIQTLTASAPVLLIDRTPPTPKQIYGFVGTVTNVDATNGQVTVNLTATLPSSLAAPGTSATFTVGPHTLILGGSNATSSAGDYLRLFGGSLSNVSDGDIVAGALVAPAGDTLAQIEALPLSLLLDLPAPVSSSAQARAKQNALREAVALIEGKSLGSAHHRRHRHRATRHHHRSARKG